MKKRKISWPILQALAALTSSILTEAIIEQLFPNEYTGNYIDGILKISEVVSISSWARIIFILSIFLLIWLSLAIFLPGLEALFFRLKYRNKPRYRKQGIIRAYRDIKRKLKQIAFHMEIYSMHNDESKNVAAMYFVDIAKYINTLYRYFCPNNKAAKKVVRSVFRESEHVRDIDKYISPYDYDLYICLLCKLYEKASENHKNNSYFESDSIELTNRLEKLKQVTKFYID